MAGFCDTMQVATKVFTNRRQYPISNVTIFPPWQGSTARKPALRGGMANGELVYIHGDYVWSANAGSDNIIRTRVTKGR